MRENTDKKNSKYGHFSRSEPEDWKSRKKMLSEFFGNNFFNKVFCLLLFLFFFYFCFLFLFMLALYGAV